MKVRQRAPRHIPDLDQVVATTIDILKESGESGFRIETLMDRTGVSKSSLYASFGSRDGLIAAAHARHFEVMILESIEPVRAIVDNAASREDLRQKLQQVTAYVANLSRTSQRVERAAVIAGTKGRPEYSRWLAEAQTRLSTEFENVITQGQNRGHIRKKYQPRLIANFVQAIVFGRVIVGFDLEAGPNELDRWLELTNDLFDRMLFID